MSMVTRLPVVLLLGSLVFALGCDRQPVRMKNQPNDPGPVDKTVKLPGHKEKPVGQ